MTNQEMLHKYNCFRERTARRSGKLVKRIVAVASLALDGFDVLAHFLPGKVGGAPLAVPEGHAGIPVVDHRLGLAKLAIPARESHGSGVELSGRGCRSRARLCEGATQGPVPRAVIGAATVQGDGLLLLAEVVGHLKHRLALTCQADGGQSLSTPCMAKAVACSRWQGRAGGTFSLSHV